MANTKAYRREFTDEEVREIRTRYAEARADYTIKLRLVDLAEEYGVSYSSIHHLVTRRTYRSVV